MKAVKIDNLSFSYNTYYALNGINLELDKGKKVVVLGANGSGKTTLFYHFNGLLLPQAGKIEILGTKITKNTCREIRQKVGMVFENPDNQLISTSVYDDIAFGLRNYRWSEEYIKKRVYYALSKVEAEELVESSPYNLSWGQKKRIAIAGVLAMEPELLVLDEPFTGLDPQVSNNLLKLLDELNSEGKTIIIAAHDVDLAYSWGDEVVILSRGKKIRQGPPDILADEEEMERAFLATPILAEAFKDTPYRPKNIKEARSALEKLMKNNGDE